MKSQEVKKVISKLPDSPGVYLFLAPRTKNLAPKILYIGKATSLRDRVKSYMSSRVLDTRGPLIEKMLSQFDTIDHIQTDSVLEALVLEANLIKKHQPEANIKEKDNRSFNFVVITKEDFPRVLVVRGRELLQHNFKNNSTTIYDTKIKKENYKIGHSFGPFPSGEQLREALKIIRKMFPYRDKCVPLSGKPCFNRQIGLCPGVCTGEISKEEYAKQIENVILFFEGNKKRLMKNLEKQMQSFSKNREFERANLTKRTLFTLNHIQDISLIKEEVSRTPLDIRSQMSKGVFDTPFRIESYDIAHLSGTNVVGVMTVVEDGEKKLSDYRKFKIHPVQNSGFQRNPVSNGTWDHRIVNDTAALAQILSRRLAHIEWRFPDLIVVDGSVAQKRVMEKILRENKVDIPVVSVVKDEYHRPKEILGDKKWLVHEREILLSNSEAHRFAIGFHKQLRRKM